MKKKTQKVIVDQILSKKKEKRNITFRIENEIVSEFQKICKKNKVTMNEVVDKLIRDFIELP